MCFPSHESMFAQQNRFTCLDISMLGMFRIAGIKGALTAALTVASYQRGLGECAGDIYFLDVWPGHSFAL
jgi:hypothetical protein